MVVDFLYILFILYSIFCYCYFSMARRKSKTFQTPTSSFWGNGTYCPARNNPSELSHMASLFLHRKHWYYVKLRVALRNDTKKRLLHYLKSGDVFSYPGWHMKFISKNVIDIYDTLHTEPIGSIFYRWWSKKNNIQ